MQDAVEIGFAGIINVEGTNENPQYLETNVLNWVRGQ